jgi:hypothetical protein
MPVRWSSTHAMIEKFYSIKTAVKSVSATQNFDESVNSVTLSDEDWTTTKELLDFFSIFVKTTTVMQADRYLTLNRTLPEYYRLIKSLEDIKNSTGKLVIHTQPIKDATVAALNKMTEYFSKQDNSPTAFVATICDP